MKDYSEFFLDLQKQISYKSEAGEAVPNKPFGEQVDGALSHYVLLAKKMGFDYKTYDGYAVEISYGEGEEIGIIGHVDVVPAGGGWTTDPYTLTQKDGYLYGRGVQDDKGPMLLCLYALKELKDSKIVPKRKFRFFVGGNEETGWADVAYLQKQTILPEYGFSPDGNFPVCYAEKGVYPFKFYLPLLKNFDGIHGGTVINSVCAYASCTAKPQGLNYDLLAKYSLKEKGGVIESFGKAAHGSAPHLGKNAIKPLFEYFLEMGEDVQNVLDCLFNDVHGLSKLCTEQGNVTFSPNLIGIEGDKMVISCDCRVPAPLTLNDVLAIVDKFNMEYTVSEKHDPVLVNKDGWFVNAMMQAYNSVTGEALAPKSLSGSTFARAFKYGCAFGPEFPNENSHIHEQDERVSVESLMRAYEIYKRTIFALATK